MGVCCKRGAFLFFFCFPKIIFFVYHIWFGSDFLMVVGGFWEDFGSQNDAKMG